MMSFSSTIAVIEQSAEPSHSFSEAEFSLFITPGHPTWRVSKEQHLTNFVTTQEAEFQKVNINQINWKIYDIQNSA